MINVRLKPKQGIKVGLKTVYLYDETLIADQVNKAKEWAIKTDGKVQEEGVDVDYSSKHYAGLSKESENNAKQSELNAKTSELNASESAKNADADADNAAESATIAYNSEQNAIAQANKATEEANAAAESAYQAQTSALAAHEYASNAEADAQNALETLGHVLEAETNATNAATTAIEQAGIATEKATEAGTHATNAGVSATNAKTSEDNAKNYELGAKGYSETATQEANASAESAYQSQQSALASSQYASDAESDAQNALETLGHVLESETVSTNAANTATQKAQEASESAADAQESAEEAQRIKDSLGNIYVFKGSVNTIADLPENANIGDVYDVLDSGTNYAWTGDRWDSLGASFDLSEYAKKTDIKNGTLTIQKNGVNIATFTANQSGNTTANIVADTQVNADWNATGGVAQILNKPTIPTTTSQLTNNSDFTTKAYVDTTEQEIIQNFMQADTDLQTQITGLSGVLDVEQNKIMAIEGKIPTNASTSNMLSTASDLLNATQDVRSDLAEADSELQTQINGQATAISDLSDDVMANMGEIADIKEQIKNVGGGLEIGDIGIAPLGIDESKNLRRYLNGQVISQSQFVAFTNLIKQRILTNPSIATTEENWQSEVSLSKLGQCGKFVIDDTAGTIRLPKVVNINGLQDLTVLGGIKAESLPNIKGDVGYTVGNNANATGAFTKDTNSNSAWWSGATNVARASIFHLDASLSSSTYQDDAPVQQEAVQYPYFIQVATGNEEQADITTEIQLNNPFSLLDYKWSEYELTNASWLLSNGVFHSGATYPAVYELLLKIYNGTETKQGVSVKLNTETYEDTDFVLNTADTTFRLPLKVKLASGNKVAGNGMTLGLTDGTTERCLSQYNGTGFYSSTNVGSNIGTTSTLGPSIIQAITIGVTTDPTKSGIETSSQDLYLYFYVGETVQDANIISASQVLTKVANGIDRTSATDRETVVGWGMPDYSANIAISNPVSSNPYTAPSDGFINIAFLATYEYITKYYINGNEFQMSRGNSTNTWTGNSIFIPVSKGDEFYIKTNLYSGSNITYDCKFIPMKGVR